MDHCNVRVTGIKDSTKVGHTRRGSQGTKLLTKGRFSKTCRILDSRFSTQSSMQDPGVVTQLDAKHGKRDYELPRSFPQNLPQPGVALEAKDLKRVYISANHWQTVVHAVFEMNICVLCREQCVRSP